MSVKLLKVFSVLLKTYEWTELESCEQVSNTTTTTMSLDHLGHLSGMTKMKGCPEMKMHRACFDMKQKTFHDDWKRRSLQAHDWGIQGVKTSCHLETVTCLPFSIRMVVYSCTAGDITSTTATASCIADIGSPTADG